MAFSRIDSVRRTRFTSPLWGEVDLRSKSGEGALWITIGRNPSPQPSPNGRGRALSLPLRVNLISSCSDRAIFRFQSVTAPCRQVKRGRTERYLLHHARCSELPAGQESGKQASGKAHT